MLEGVVRFSRFVFRSSPEKPTLAHEQFDSNRKCEFLGRSVWERPRLTNGEQRHSKKPTRGAVFGGPSMNPSYTVGTRRSSLGISAWRNVAHRTEYESSSLFIEHWFKKR